MPTEINTETYHQLSEYPIRAVSQASGQHIPVHTLGVNTQAIGEQYNYSSGRISFTHPVLDAIPGAVWHLQAHQTGPFIDPNTYFEVPQHVTGTFTLVDAYGNVRSEAVNPVWFGPEQAFITPQRLGVIFNQPYDQVGWAVTGWDLTASVYAAVPVTTTSAVVVPSATPPPANVPPGTPGQRINSERRAKQTLVRWTRRHDLQTIYHTTRLAQRAHLTIGAMYWSERPFMLAGMRETITSVDDPPQWVHEAEYSFERLPGKNREGGNLYIGFDEDGEAEGFFGEGVFT